MRDIVIRAATADDVPLLMRGLRGIAEHLGETGELVCTEADLRAHGFGPQPAFQAAVAEAGGAFAGMSVFFPIFSTWYGKPGMFVQDLYVEPAFRSQGIGERLLRHVAQLAHKHGGVYLRLSVDEDNRRAHGFYLDLGLVHSHDQRSYIAQGDAFAALAGEGMTQPVARVRQAR
ncbi:GNAT family N-acetyltransferase [Aminobacter sp. HY435]|uniref:GNAT family N-acetyltransferase n=1 Tax=Aminobacter sp. HY435 TaxID=2970917 RepID=UPI0022B9A810|nr:GNAT family N-acetyltransferase [Aminobacter sp. HY435]